MRSLRGFLLVVFLCLCAGSAGHWLVQQWRFAQGLVRADPLTYVSFAENLSAGQYAIDSPLADLAERYQPKDGAGRFLSQGPKWNWSVREDGRSVYTTAIGYPLFQAGVIRLGGTGAVVRANIILWGLVFLFVFLFVWEGMGRSWASAFAGGAAVLAIPWIDVTIQQMVAPWREPLFLCCLTGAAWLLARFWRSGGLVSACGMALLLGYAVAVKEANAVYLLAFALIFLTTPKLWKRGAGGVAARLLLPALFGLLGLVPLFLHNLGSHGHPLASSQFQRATRMTVAETPSENPPEKKAESKKEIAEVEDAPAVVMPKKGLNLGIQYRMGHYYWFEYGQLNGGKFFWRWWWFGLAMVGLLWLLRGRTTWREVLGAAVLTGVYLCWGYIETWVWGDWWPDPAKNPGLAQSMRLVTWGVTALCWLVLALVTRRRLGWFLLAFIGVHFALYFSFASMDPRHMVVAMVVYAVCLGVGAFGLLMWLGGLFRVPERWRPVLGLGLAIGVLAPALLWKPFGGFVDKQDLFTVERGMKFGADLRAAMVESDDESPVLFANRFLSEVAEVYGKVPVMRLHELMRLVSLEVSLDRLLAELEDGGHTLYFLDCRDLDPQNIVRGIDFSRVDGPLLRRWYDLEQVGNFKLDDYRLQFGGETPQVSLYRLSRHEPGEQRAMVDVPDDGASFLVYDTQGNDLELDIAKDPVDVSDAFRSLHPVSNFDLRDNTTLRAVGKDGAVIPTLASASFLNWRESLSLPASSRSNYEVTGIRESLTGGVEARPENGVFDVPVRVVSNGFAVAGLEMRGIKSISDEELFKRGISINLSKEVFTVLGPDGQAWTRPANVGACYFALPPPKGVALPWSGWTTLKVQPVSDVLCARVTGIKSEVARTRFRVPTDDRSTMVIVYGRLAGADPARIKTDYRMLVNGKVIDEGECFSNPWRSANEFQKLIRLEKPGEALDVSFEGAGLILSDFVLVRDRFEIPYGPRMALFPEAFYQPPQDGFVWTKGAFSLPVPVIPGRWRYTLMIYGRDGEPDGKVRAGSVRLGDVERPFALTRGEDPKPWHGTFTVDSDASELREVEIRLPTWSPKRRAEARQLEDESEYEDDRELGFQLYRFVWELAWR